MRIWWSLVVLYVIAATKGFYIAFAVSRSRKQDAERRQRALDAPDATLKRLEERL